MYDTVCAACALKTPSLWTSSWTIDDLRSTGQLIPRLPHSRQRLVSDMLLALPSTDSDDPSLKVALCHRCDKSLRLGRVPKLALANGTWVGEIPGVLANLSVAEKVLVARSALGRTVMVFEGGHVSSSIQLLPIDGRMHLPLDDVIMPRSISDLKALVSIVGHEEDIATMMQCPDLTVNRDRVRLALLWLKGNNDVYANCVISEERLGSLPPEVAIVHTPDDVLASSPSIKPGIFISIVASQYRRLIRGFADLHLMNRSDALIPARVRWHIDSECKITKTVVKLTSVQDPFNLLTTFPVLFPHGFGGPYGQHRKVPFGRHCIRFMRYSDGRFEDPMFMHSLFDILRRRQAHRTDLLLPSCLQPIKNDAQKEVAIREVFARAALLNERIIGTDEHRCLAANRFRAMSTTLGSPSLTLTMKSQGKTVHDDTVHDILYFHDVLSSLLNDGIRVQPSSLETNGAVVRRDSVLGSVTGFMGDLTIDSHGYPTVFMIIWLQDTPTCGERASPTFLQHLLALTKIGPCLLTRLIDHPVQLQSLIGQNGENNDNSWSLLPRYLGRTQFTKPDVHNVDAFAGVPDSNYATFLLDDDLTTAVALRLNINRVPPVHLVMRYLLGFENDICSHKFVRIEWDIVLLVLEQVYPDLRGHSAMSVLV
jgi:hypothetical protein